MIYLAILLIGFLVGATPVQAAYGINRTVSFQGKLVTSAGVNVPNSTPVTATFSIYQTNSSCPGGGTAVWSENQTFTPVDGIFKVALGSVTPFGTNIDFSQDTLYLGIQISGESSEMCSGSSRIQLAAVPQAFNAESFAGLTADDSQTGLFTISGGQTTERTLTVNGDITIGSTIRPTSAGGLTIQSNGANTLTLDTGGAATLSVGASSSTITIGSAGATGVSITDDSWSVSTAGAASFASITAASNNSINASNYGVDFADSDTNPTCAAGDYKVYADTSDGRLKKCQNGIVSDLAQDVDIYNRAKSADQSVTSSTTLTDETALQFPIGASDEWNVIWNLVVSNNNDAGPDWKAAVVGPAGNTCDVLQSGAEPAGTAFPQATTSDCIEAPGTLVNNAILASTVPFIVNITANIAGGGTAGTVKVQFAQNTSDTTALTVKAGSVMNAYRVTGADLAEFYYTLDETLKPGDVVTLDSFLPDGVKKSQKAYDNQVMGVISTQPGLVMGGGSVSGGYPALVALTGRVPVTVSSENGSIKPGDMLTASSVPGVAMKMTKSGMGIGMAMTGFEGEGLGMVTVFVSTGFYNGSGVIDVKYLNTVEDKMGAISDLLNKSSYQIDKDAYIAEFFADRVVAGLEVITPVVYADQIYADRIQAREISGLQNMVASESARILAGLLPTPTMLPTAIPTPTMEMGILQDLMEVKGLTVNGPAVFADSAEFKKVPEFSSDTAGFGVMLAETDWVEIVFENEYKSPPVVIIGDNFFGLKVANRTTKGFRVEYDKKLKQDIDFTWMAIAVAEPKTFRSVLPTPTILPQPTQVLVPEQATSSAVIDVGG